MPEPFVSLGGSKPTDAEPDRHVDPVCKMLVSAETAAASHEYEGKTYYFCMPGCRDKFAAEPERFSGSLPYEGRLDAALGGRGGSLV